MQLDTISIRGFRSIADLQHLEVGSPTLLTGHNDAGKSAILDAVRFLLNDYNLTGRDPTFLARDPDAEKVSPVPRVDETIVEGRLSLSNDEQEALGLTESIVVRRVARQGGLAEYEISEMIPDEELLQDYAKLGVPDLKARVQELGLVVEGTNKPHYLAALDEAAGSAPSTLGWTAAQKAVVQALPRALRFNPSGTTDAEDAIRTALQTAYKNHMDADTLKTSLRGLERSLETQLKKDAAGLRDHIMKQCPDIGEVQILPSVSFEKGLRSTQISVTNPEGEDVHLGEAGAGRARRVSLAVWEFNTGLLNGSGDTVLLYDEPDTHLDYTHQREFMTLIRAQSALPNVRMLIATHSMNMIDGVDIADVVHVRHDEYRTVVDRLVDDTDVGKHLGAIAASLGLRNTVLLHERLFVGVEGDTEAQAFPVLFRLATGRQLESSGIALWACKNNDGALQFARFLVHHGRKVAFVVDKDSLRHPKHIFSEKQLGMIGLSTAEHAGYLGEDNEFEEIFSNEQWADVANLKWAHNEGHVWTPDDVQVLRKGKFSENILNEFKTNSFTGPRGKPEMVTTLALNLETAGDVPLALRQIFDVLVARADATAAGTAAA